jgi:hypothetical protein
VAQKNLYFERMKVVHYRDRYSVTNTKIREGTKYNFLPILPWDHSCQIQTVRLHFNLDGEAFQLRQGRMALLFRGASSQSFTSHFLQSKIWKTKRKLLSKACSPVMEWPALYAFSAACSFWYFQPTCLSSPQIPSSLVFFYYRCSRY